MDELASLQIKVSSIEAQLADKRLSSLERSAIRSERATDKLTKGFARMAGPLLAVAGATAGLSKLVSVTREFEVLNAQLVTATGSAENAATAMEAIQDFASNTPYDLQQVTEGFTKLVNLGLTPSERALTSYGDTASAMGKDLNQLIEAVADAATGEFERLKEFGIRASSQGDQVAFTFRGVTTTVQKEAGAIEEYLTQLGENNFAGAMTERMNTLDGAISNLGDQWDLLFNNISESGIGEVIEDTVRIGIDILEEFNAALDSGQVGMQLDAILGKFDGFGRDFATVVDQLNELWSMFASTDEAGGMGAAITATIDFIVDAFINLPENLRAAVQLLTVELATLVDYGKFYGQAFAETIGTELALLVQKAGVYGEAIGEALNPFGDDSVDVDARIKELTDLAEQQTDKAFKLADERAENSRKARLASISDILAERDADVKAFEERTEAANSAREAFDKAAEARAKGAGDRLAAFGTGAQEGEGEDKEPSKDFEKLVKELQTEEEKIKESYERRRQIILDNTEETSDARKNLMEKLNEDLREDLLVNDGVGQDYDSQIDALNDFYERRKNLILEMTQLTEEERGELEEELEAERLARLEEMELARQSVILKGTSDILGSAADITAKFAGEQSGIYKGLFAASKAFAIAESIVSITQGIANAARLPFPANIPAMATVAGSTAGLISTIQGTNLDFAGAFDKGGNIPQGSFGLVGEFGPELIQGPANITSREDTMKMFREGNNNQSSVVNNFTATIQADRNGFVRPESLRQVEAAMYNAQRRAQRSVA